MQIPVRDIRQIGCYSRTGFRSVAGLNLISQISRVVSAKCHTHQVVEAVTFEREFERFLVHDHILNLLLLPGNQCQRVGNQGVHRHRVILVPGRIAGTATVDTHRISGLIIEQILEDIGGSREVEVRQPGRICTVAGNDTILQKLVVHTGRKEMIGELRITGCIQGLGQTQINQRAPIGTDARNTVLADILISIAVAIVVNHILFVVPCPRQTQIALLIIRQVIGSIG